MNISLAWLGRYLEGEPLAAEAVEHALTFAGFPIESRTPLPGGDVRLDVEVTSNRGDCLSHLGLARELAAATGRGFVPPAFVDAVGSGEPGFSLANHAPEACPHFTARVIRGVRVGASPAWLVAALEAIGQRSINSVVDATNFINAEFGNPCHVFDLDRLEGAALIVRKARAGEALTTLDAKPRKLHPDDVVVADVRGATSLAGVIGGLDSSVTASTTSVVFEMATWEPACVRASARRHAIRTDASHRFERTVDAGTIDLAARRAVALIVELAGGTPSAATLRVGRPLAPAREVEIRAERCSSILGYRVSVDDIARVLRALQIESAPTGNGQSLRATIPAHRPDLDREIDLIEEVARIRGLDVVPILDRLPIRARPPQASEVAARETGTLLASLGFYEAVTFSFLSAAHAGAFLPPGSELVALHAKGAGEGAHPAGGPEAYLRPSLVPSLMLCRRANHHANPGRPVRLFEAASVYAQAGGGSRERRTLALLLDVAGASFDDRQAALRSLRGVVEALARTIAGASAALEFTPCSPSVGGFEPDAHARVRLAGRDIGSLGLVSASARAAIDLDVQVVACELDLEPLLEAYPGASGVRALPAFPAIERDLTLVVDEGVAWARAERVVRDCGLEHLDGFEYVSTYRGKGVGESRKSLTLRLRFRSPDRTLRKEDVDPQVARLVDRARSDLGATLRA